MEEEARNTRPRKLTVFAYGEGEDEKVFLRHLIALYLRKGLVSVQTGYAAGGDPMSILDRAIRTKAGNRYDLELILLDTIPEWPQQMVERAEQEGIVLIGSSPCIESFFFEILGRPDACDGLSPWKCKALFEKEYCASGNFNEDECGRIFTKAVLNEARENSARLNYLIGVMEGDVVLRV